MTILVTVIGTAGSLAITSMFAYAISNRNLPGRKLLSFMSIFTMLFNGGIVSSYYVYSSVFQIKNTIWALIIPNLLMNAFTVMLVRNYFANSVSPSITEAARIDGAGEFRIFARIMLPLSVPILATIGLMGAIAYWNDWTNGLYFLTERDGGHLYTVQLVLNSINEKSIFWRIIQDNRERRSNGAAINYYTYGYRRIVYCLSSLLTVFPEILH
jgi:putative aldouronate transport system permease protein